MGDTLATNPPQVDTSKDVVNRKVFINDRELKHPVLISQITVNKSFNKIAYAKLVFLDGSSSDRDFPLSNDERFKPGNNIKIQLGYHEEATTVFEGIIIKHAVKIRAQGSSLLMIEAKDKTVALTMARKSKYHIGKTDKQVIDELAEDYGPTVFDTELVHDQLVQFDATDWDFIVTRAEANGLLVLTDDGKIIIKKLSMGQSSVLTVTHGKDIWELEAETDARRQIKEVSSRAWDFTKQDLSEPQTGESDFSETAETSASSISGALDPPSDDLGKVLGAEISLDHLGYLKEDQLKSWSNAYALRNELSKATGRVRIEGNAKLKPGDVITLAGVGKRFNGKVMVTGVLHHYEGHWQTDIQFGWREEWFYKKENVMNQPAGGLLPGVNGLQIGVVVDVDDKQQKEFRVKVHVPSMSTKEGIWARVAALDAGNNRGSYFRPEKDDEVVLGFLNDDPRDAIILGYLHSKNKHASPLPDGELQFGFVTKKGLKIVFDDKNQKMSITVPVKGGEKSIIINDSSSMEFKDENKNIIKMNASGITVDAGKGVLILKGGLVKINSK